MKGSEPRMSIDCLKCSQAPSGCCKEDGHGESWSWTLSQLFLLGLFEFSPPTLESRSESWGTPCSCEVGWVFPTMSGSHLGHLLPLCSWFLPHQVLSAGRTWLDWVLETPWQLVWWMMPCSSRLLPQAHQRDTAPYDHHRPDIPQPLAIWQCMMVGLGWECFYAQTTSATFCKAFCRATVVLCRLQEKI